MKKIEKFLFKFLFILLLWQGSGQDVQAVETIRVGYQVNYGVFKTPFKRDYPGYGFEYLSKIIEYTNGEYQLDFVPCSLDEGLYLLRIGLIDVFASGMRASQWEESYLFTDIEFARDLRFLSSTDPDYRYTGDVSDLMDVSIAVQIGDPVTAELTSYLTEIESNAKIIEIDIKNYSSILRDDSYDFVLASSLLMDSQPEMAFMISDHSSYLMALPHNGDLINDLNYGMSQVEAKDYLFKEKLTLKYFDKEYAVSDMITQSEYHLMKMQNTYYVGIEDTNSPFAYVDEEGNVAGIYADIFDLLAKDMGISPEYVILDKNTTLTQENSLDFSFLTVRDEKLAANTQSSALFHVPYLLIQRSDRDLDPEKTVVGTLDYYDLLDEEINLFVTTEDVQEFQDETALRLAFEAGAVDVMFLTSSTYDSISHLLDPYVTTASPVDYYFSPTLNFEETYPSAKIEIINKFIERLESHEVDYIIQKHSKPTKEPLSFGEIQARYPILMGSGFTLISLGFFLVFLLERNKKRNLMQVLSVDSLTGLMTEHSFKNQVQEVFTQFPDKKYGIVSVDVDNFKYINEVHGFSAGSEFLKDFALFLNELLEHPLLSARTTSDHFLFLVEEGDLVEHLDRTIGKNPSLLNKCGSFLPANYSYGFSMGLYLVFSNKIPVEEMIDCANYARYEGKEETGSTFHLFSDEMMAERAQNSALLTSVETAFEQGEFVLHYQESIDVKSKEIRHTEVLLRWNHGGEQIFPAEFLPILEANGYLMDLDFYVLDRVCQLIVRQRELSLPPFSVNLSSETVQEPHFQENLLKLIESYKVQPTQIQLEIPESVFWDATPALLERLESLQGVGFRFVVDGFSGNISLFSHVHGLPFDSLKLDPSFVAESMKDRKGTGILTNLIKICKSFHLEIAMKKIETQEELKFAKSVGADTIQGFYLCKTRSLDEFLNHFKSGRFHKEKENPKEIQEEPVEEPEEEPVVLQLGKQANRFTPPEEPTKKTPPKEDTLSVELRNLESMPVFLDELPSTLHLPNPSLEEEVTEEKVSDEKVSKEATSRIVKEKRERFKKVQSKEDSAPVVPLEETAEPELEEEDDTFQEMEEIPEEVTPLIHDEDENLEEATEIEEAEGISEESEEELLETGDVFEEVDDYMAHEDEDYQEIHNSFEESDEDFSSDDANFQASHDHNQEDDVDYDEAPDQYEESDHSLEEGEEPFEEPDHVNHYQNAPSPVVSVSLSAPDVMVPKTVLSQSSLHRETPMDTDAPPAELPSGALDVSFPEFLSEAEPTPKPSEKIFDTQKLPSFTAFPRKKVSLESPPEDAPPLPRVPEILKKKRGTPLEESSVPPQNERRYEDSREEPEETPEEVEELDLEIPAIIPEEKEVPKVPTSIKNRASSSEKSAEPQGKIPNRVKERLVSPDKSLESTGRIPNRVKERLNIPSSFTPAPTKKKADESPSVFSPGELEEVDLDE